MNKCTILLVDDEDAILYALEKDLLKVGYSVDTASCGREAIQKLGNNNYDLTISDLVLGDMNGIEVLKEAKRKSEAPAIVITGHGELSSAIESLRLGAFDYLEKPCGRKEFISKVNKAIQQYHEKDSLKQKLKVIENEVKLLEIDNLSKEKIVKILENNSTALEIILEEKNNELQRKNIALAEVLSHLENEKAKIKQNIQSNIDHLVLPLLTKVRNENLIANETYLILLEEAFENLASEFGVELSKIEPKLSPKETEICHMIRAGIRTKEIATALKISDRTVETHRTNIRRKLNLSNKKYSLPNFLKKFS